MFGGRQISLWSWQLEEQKKKADQFDELNEKLKLKFKNVNSKDEKYQILTLLPTGWSARKIESEFGCSFHMANTSKTLQNEKGLLSTPNRKLASNILAVGVKDLVEKFYLEDDISRIMPGQKDCVSMVVNGNFFNLFKSLVGLKLRKFYTYTGMKQKIHKRMLLSTMNSKIGMKRSSSLYRRLWNADRKIAFFWEVLALTRFVFARYTRTLGKCCSVSKF